MAKKVDTADEQRLWPSVRSPGQGLVLVEDLPEAVPMETEDVAKEGEAPPTRKGLIPTEMAANDTPASDLSANSKPQAPPFTVWMNNWPGYLITTEDDAEPLHPCNS